MTHSIPRATPLRSLSPEPQAAPEHLVSPPRLFTWDPLPKVLPQALFTYVPLAPTRPIAPLPQRQAQPAALMTRVPLSMTQRGLNQEAVPVRHIAPQQLKPPQPTTLCRTGQRGAANNAVPQSHAAPVMPMAMWQPARPIPIDPLPQTWGLAVLPKAEISLDLGTCQRLVTAQAADLVLQVAAVVRGQLVDRHNLTALARLTDDGTLDVERTYAEAMGLALGYTHSYPPAAEPSL